MSEGVRLTIEVYWPVDAQRHRTSLGVDRHSRGPHEIATDAQLHHQPHEPEFGVPLHEARDADPATDPQGRVHTSSPPHPDRASPLVWTIAPKRRVSQLLTAQICPAV
jgi:hypothetical protein